MKHFTRTMKSGMVVYRGVIYVPVMDFDHSILDGVCITLERRPKEPSVLYWHPTENEKSLTGIKSDVIKFKRRTL